MTGQKRFCGWAKEHDVLGVHERNAEHRRHHARGEVFPARGAIVLSRAREDLAFYFVEGVFDAYLPPDFFFNPFEAGADLGKFRFK